MRPLADIGLLTVLMGTMCYLQFRPQIREKALANIGLFLLIVLLFATVADFGASLGVHYK